ncbi:MAG: VWA domain-containing protein [Actinobacteria bacterium]|nr:VWA domain-containing protein [Actinomycetota bacterium]
MTFAWPWALTALPVVVGVAALAWWVRRRTPRGIAFPDMDLVAAAAERPRVRRFIPPALGALAVVALVVALARPQTTRAVPREQATIMLAIDVSGSMAADDISPYRLRAAQDAAIRFAERVPRQYQIGLVSFAAQASVVLPPTTDRIALRNGIEGLVADGNTAIGDAIEESLDAMRQTQPEATTLRAARILLLSDGSNRVGVTLEQAAADARRLGVPVFTVALGTPDGTLPDGTPVPPDPGALKTLAEATGGRGFESRDSGALGAVYDRLGVVVATERIPAESTGRWAIASVAFLLAAAGTGMRFGRRLT